MARRLNTNLVALGSAAIVSIYAVGYVWTQPAANSAAVLSAVVTATPAATSPLPFATSAGASAATAAAPISTATAIARAIAGATGSAAPTPAPVASATAAQGYRDGVYAGSGSSRRGGISVAVTIESGQITTVTITRSTTYYPISDVARLPGQVVSRQSANVDFVSGATESSRAFRGAVTQALSQASGPSAAVPAAVPAFGTRARLA